MIATKTKERPILFSSPMIRPLLAGNKTQTRRVTNPQPKSGWLGYMMTEKGTALLNGPDYPDGDEDELRCPYGVAGDRLWVRESWARMWGLADSECTGPKDAYFKATASEERHAATKWSPSIHMPRWACRLVLEITGVRVERVQSISAKDIIAEGVIDRPHKVEYLSGMCPVSAVDKCVYPDLRSLWAGAWIKINGKESWILNPWCWVIEFCRIEKGNP